LVVYLDTSVVAPLFVVDTHTPIVLAWLRRIAESQQVTLSDWTVSEFSGAIAAANRAGRVPAAMRAASERGLDRWVEQQGGALPVLSDDVRKARRLIGETTEPLRAPEALHIAIAERQGASLATLDIGMRRAAADLGLAVADL
jgi:predicted nucleic acid-binding protein